MTTLTAAAFGLFYAWCDDEGLCCCFREWWHSRQDDTFTRQPK